MDAHTADSTATPVRWIASCSLIMGRSLHLVQIGLTRAKGLALLMIRRAPKLPSSQSPRRAPSIL
jgi:hypothetical protein